MCKLAIVGTLRGMATTDGAGASLVRVFPSYNLSYLDPFLMLDHFGVTPPAGFPDHPHRGFEIITYMLEGAFHHRDNAGNDTIIPTDGLQRVTAGSGIIHSEMPATDGVNRGLQLWINLPRKDKKVDPSYQEVTKDDLPLNELQGLTIKTLVGEHSPVSIQRPMVYYDVTLTSGATSAYIMTIPQGWRGFVYVIDGEANFGGAAGSAQDILPFEPEAKELSLPVTTDTSVRFIWVAGEPIGERPLFRGSFVD